MRPTAEHPQMKVLTPTGTKWEDVAVPLPVLEVTYKQGQVVNFTTWRLSWRERLRVLFGAYIVFGLCVKRPPLVFAHVRKLEELTGPLVATKKRKRGEKKSKLPKKHRRRAGKGDK